MSRINPQKKRSVLFVCAANQCRSPMAMALFRNYVNQNKDESEGWRIESAGVWAITGYPATDAAIRAVNDLGLVLTDHISRSVTEPLLTKFNLILCMEESHKNFLNRNFPVIKNRVFLLSEMSDEIKDIWDPIGKPIFSYKETISEIQNIFDTGFIKICELSSK